MTMRPESELVPYAPGELPGDPVLVLAPHPDDEVFGCGGFLALAADEDRRVTVTILTDGGAQGDPGVRREESREAARRLGLPEPRFAGLADRSLEPDGEALLAALRSAIESVRPALVLLPSPAEIHPDHRAVALAVHALAVRGAIPPGARLACYEVSAMLRPNLLLDVGAVWDRVLAAARAFGSQLGTHPYLEVLECAAQMRRLTLGPAVERAEAYHVTDAATAARLGLTGWAGRQGPVEGLEAEAGTRRPRRGWLARRLRSGRR